MYSFGLNKSYGSALGYGGGGGYSYSGGYNNGYSGYTPSYSSGYSSYLSRVVGGYYSSQNTSDSYKRSYTSDNISGKSTNYNDIRLSSNGCSGHNYESRYYSRSKTDNCLDSTPTTSRTSTNHLWRSKSTDGGTRESRSMSRDLYNRESSLDYRDSSSIRDISRDYSSARSYTPSRDFTPSREFTPARDFYTRRESSSSQIVPPPRLKKYGFHKSTGNLNDVSSASSKFNSGNTKLVRSSSYHDLQDVHQLNQLQHNQSYNSLYNRGLGNSSSDLTRTRSTANLFSPRLNEGNWNGSNSDLSRPVRLSSLISLSGGNGSVTSLTDLGYQSQNSSRRQSFAVRYQTTSTVQGAPCQ